MAWQCALSPGAAREHVRVARALTGLPVTAAAFAAGRLSFSKVRAITRVADAGTEVELVELATHTTASQLDRVVRAWRRADDLDEGRVAERRDFAWSWDDDGMLLLRVRMDAESGAEFLAAIESVAERDARRDRAAAKRAGSVPQGIPRGQRTARRLAALNRLAAVAATADRRPGDPPRREVVVHVDADVLADDAAAGKAHLDGGPALHPARVRRMLCEATVVGMVHRNGEPLAMGRRRRIRRSAPAWRWCPSRWHPSCPATAAPPWPTRWTPPVNGWTSATSSGRCWRTATTCAGRPPDPPGVPAGTPGTISR